MRPLSWPRRILRWLRPPRRLKFTREGRYFVAISIGIGLAAMNTGNNLLYLLLGWLLSVIIASGVLSDVTMRGLSVRRRPPGQIYANRPFLMEISVENTKRSLASYSIEIEDLEGEKPIDKKCYFLKIPSGRTQRTSYRHTFGRRGAYTFEGFRIGTKFPFALFHKSRDVRDSTDGALIVFPAIRPVPVPPPRAARQGETAHSKLGRRGEFFGLREYRPGDDHRDVHWRSTARTGHMMVREYEEESQRRVTLVIDNALPAPATDGDADAAAREAADAAADAADAARDAADGAGDGGHVRNSDTPADRLERAISLTASLASAYVTRGYGIRLVARGVHVPMAAGRPQLYRVLKALALLETATEGVTFADRVDPRAESVLVVPAGVRSLRGRPTSVSHVMEAT